AQMSEERYVFNLDDVLLYDLSLPIGGAPSHYIFISAFCCSTLLARLLDRVPGCLVLREPTILGQLAMTRFQPRVSGDNTSPLQSDEEWEEEWRTWAALGMRLLTRTFEPGETVIIKAADACNSMLDVILANGRGPNCSRGSKAVLLSVGLRTFILSVLKAEDRRKWIRNRAEFWHKTLTLFPVLSGVRISELDDAGKAAYCWLVTGALWDQFRKQTVPQRLLPMDGEEVSDDPRTALAKVATLFGLPLEGDAIENILADPVLSHHAKFPGQTYDAARRRGDIADWEIRFGAEADRAMEWAVAIREKLEADGIQFSAMADSMAGGEREELMPCDA
ncbi:MAG: hypothetical protein ACRD2G_13060, partial [Terriglobia bacterium]